MANRTRRNLNLSTCFVAPLLKLRTSLLFDLIADVVTKNDKLIQQLQQSQLQAGISADGSPIAPGYTPFTKAIKAVKRQPTDRVTLYDTGSFYKSIYAAVFADQFLVDATDSKTGELTEKYGSGIFGLTDSNLTQFINTIRPQLLARVRNQILKR